MLIFKYPLILRSLFVYIVYPPLPLKKTKTKECIFFLLSGIKAVQQTKSKSMCSSNVLKILGYFKRWYPLKSEGPLFILRSQGQGLCTLVIDWLIKCFNCNWQDKYQIRFNGTNYGHVNHYYFQLVTRPLVKL